MLRKILNFSRVVVHECSEGKSLYRVLRSYASAYKWGGYNAVRSKMAVELRRDARQFFVDIDNSLYVQLSRQAKPHPLFYKPYRTYERAQSNEAKYICFYLPQFHPIHENDKWWGKGFTEWWNVGRAVPQFFGHYQPRLPGELNYYDIRTPGVMARQIELAKNYGIHGFCFHYYWFSGRRVLETPLKQILGDPKLEIPFSICWANENWTRRWDGLDSDVLLAQEHTVDSDNRFIEDAVALFSDPRYIHFNSRPLLVVYRPKLLTDALATTAHWRAVVKAKTGKDLLLVGVQFYGDTEPTEMGFDYGLQFPPHNLKVVPHNKDYAPYDENFAGSVFRYSQIIETESEASYTALSKKQIRGVFPAWDNTARKMERAHIFHGSTPALFSHWLYDSTKFAKANTLEGEPVVFINAWNEWAEGAYLEPDRHFGYAYLEAVRRTLNRFDKKEALDELSPPPPPGSSDTAVLLHLYYPDLADEFAEALNRIGSHDLYISVASDISAADMAKVHAIFPAARIYCLENRGRDVYPFWTIFTRIKDLNYKYLLKLHSKKSPHRTDGDVWRNQLVTPLTENTEKIASIKRSLDAGAAMVCPRNYKFKYAEQIGSNHQQVIKLLQAAHQTLHRDASFVAGTMFWVKFEKLRPFLDIGISRSDFEIENGQMDGTLAHALERVIPIYAEATGGAILEV